MLTCLIVYDFLKIYETFFITFSIEVNSSCCNLISTTTNAHTQNIFTLKHLKSLQHVSIFLDHLQGATLFLTKVTFLKKHSLIDFLTLV